MGKIGDLWVRLSLKSDDYKKGMNDAKKETTSFSSKLKNMKAGAVAVWAAIGTSVIALAKDFISSTNKIGDAWEQTMGGMKQSWQTFKGMLTNGDFKNFGKRMKDAFTGGKEGVAAADEVYEITNKLNIARAKMQSTLNDLYFAMTDPAKTLEERIAAGKKYLSMQEDLYKEEIAMMKRQKENAVRVWLSGTGVNASVADVEAFFGGYTGSADDAVSKMYPELRNIYENFRSDKTNQPVVDAILAYERALSAYTEENKRIIRQLNSLSAQEANDTAETIQMMALPLNPTTLKNFSEDVAAWDLDSIAREMGIEDGMADIENDMDAFLDTWRSDVEQVAELNQMLEDSFVSAFGNGMQALTDMMMGLEGADASAVLSSLMQPFADTAGQLGKMLIAQGIAVSAFKESLQKLDGPVAIAAGVGLLAISSAMRSGIKALANGGGAGSTTSYSTGSYGSSELNKYESTLTVEVTGKISGNDIVLSGKKTNDYNRR